MNARLNLAIALALTLPMAASAHRSWMLPSSTVLSGNEPWVTVDAAVSNDLFYFDHNPMRLDNLVVTAPDGTQAKPENQNTGRYRSSFDVKLSQPGTYKLAVVNDGAFASYKLGGETKRARGATVEAALKDVQADAQELQVTQSLSRLETFVTSGTPSDKALQLSGKGLEMQPITHPNDLVAGDTARFRFMLDGKPAAELEVTVIPGGRRYRDKQDEIKLKTDADGKFSVKWPEPGMYWLTASHTRAGGSAAQPTRRASYAATFEVLAP